MNTLLALALLLGAAPTWQDDLDSSVDEWGREFRDGFVRILHSELRRTEAPSPSVPMETLRRGLDAITEGLMTDWIMTFASDEMEGRLAGTQAEERSTRWIVERMREAGLEPFGDVNDAGERTYYQYFDLPDGQGRAHNCVGLLRGESGLRDVVVIGGHQDHVGMDGQHDVGRIGTVVGDDRIWNGADDNGSGTCTVLAIARAFHEAGIRPRRTILFLTFAAEEWGLLGSAHYVGHPIVPLADTALMMNFDMTGRGSLAQATTAYGCATGSDFVLDDAAILAAQVSGFDLRPGAAYGGGSDHISFVGRRVPILGVDENGVGQTDYHRATDNPDRINHDYHAGLTRAGFVMLAEMANTPKPIRWNPAFRAPGQGRTIGIYPEDLTDADRETLGLGDAGGLKVRSVIAGSPAETAGMAAGDVILEVAGTALPRENPLEALRRWLRRVRVNRDYEVVVVRGGGRVTLRVRWTE